MLMGASTNNYAFYQLGRWDEEAHQNRGGKGIFGRRRVEVDQSYIDHLFSAYRNAYNIAQDNYATGQRLLADVEELKAQLDQANAIIAEQHARIEQDKQEKKALEEQNSCCGGFLYMFTRTVEALLTAADAGKAGRTDYQAFKQFAVQMFHAYRNRSDVLESPIHVTDEYFELEKSLKK